MAIYNAYCDRVPVYILAGNSLDATLRRPGVEWAHSVQDAAAMVRDYIKWNDLPVSLPHFAESAVRAYKIAMTPPMMPVLLVVDGGLQEDPISPEVQLRAIIGADRSPRWLVPESAGEKCEPPRTQRTRRNSPQEIAFSTDMQIDSSNWSGEGAFTQVVIDWLRDVAGVVAIRVEDAPASRSEADYNFISNEIFVTFATVSREERTRRFGFLPGLRTVTSKTMTIPDLEAALVRVPDIGAPDYSDEGMLQYLRAERIVPPYQTRGYKLVELVRLYEVGTASRA